MIISKPTIETFLAEAQDPIYHQVISKEKDYGMSVEFHATAFNKNGHVVSYCHQFPWALVMDENAKRDFMNEGLNIETKFIEIAINRELLPGVISESLVGGQE